MLQLVKLQIRLPTLNNRFTDLGIGESAFKIFMKSKKRTRRTSPKNGDMEVVCKNVKSKDQKHTVEEKKVKFRFINRRKEQLKLN